MGPFFHYTLFTEQRRKRRSKHDEITIIIIIIIIPVALRKKSVCAVAPIIASAIRLSNSY